MGCKAMIKLRNVHKTFGHLEVLKGIDLEVAKGEKLVIIGPSGSGKSTLIRCMNGLEEVTKGEVYIDGQLMTHKTRAALNRQYSSMVFQQFNLYPHLTVMDNLTLGPVKLKKVRKDEAEALGYDEVEYTAVTAATRGQMLDNDELDCVIATFTIKPERKESWDFSTPYYVDAVTVLVEDESGITDLAGLKDKTVGVSSGSTSAKALAKAMAEAGVIDAFDEDTFDAATFSGGVSFKIFDDYPAISMALDAGDVDAFCVDKSILANYKTDGRSFIADSFSPQEYGVATKKGSELSAKVEELITGWLADGTIDGMIAEWGLE